MADYVVDRVVLERTEVGKAVRKLAISGLHGHLLQYVSYTMLYYIILFILYYTVLYYTILYTILLDIRCVAFSASEALRVFVFGSCGLPWLVPVRTYELQRKVRDREIAARARQLVSEWKEPCRCGVLRSYASPCCMPQTFGHFVCDRRFVRC